MRQLRDQIERLGTELEGLVLRLSALGYVFDRPEEVLPGPEPGTSEAIARIEAEVGEVPKALEVFWQQVGSVDLSGEHEEWRGCEYPDPLIVFPPSYALYELDEFLSDREEREAHQVPFTIPIAPDYLHKANVSGGVAYNISVPAQAEDPPLNDEWHNVSFLGYLELALRWGGFPGLERSPGHTWPVQKLRGTE